MGERHAVVDHDDCARPDRPVCDTCLIMQRQQIYPHRSKHPIIGIEHREGPDDITDWVAENTQPGDLVILPLRDMELRPSAIKIFDSGRSVLAVTHNPESQSALNGSTMTLPVGGSIAPT